MSIEERYRDVMDRIDGRAALVAVTKGRPLADARVLHALGQRDFAENRADALAERRPALPDARWHFIGNIQRNKVKLLAGCTLVHSFDRPELAEAWPRGVPVLLQVDFTGEPAGPRAEGPDVPTGTSGARRNGLAPDALPAALDACRAVGVDVRGLSTLPPREGDPRPHFRKLRALREALELRELSMGMSADFEVAIEEGATMVRVGRALFG
jgi:hypothetical protein